METLADSESTLARELLFGLMGGGIAIGCLLPPLLHFVTGPLGPFIGGFIATNLAHPETRGRAIIAGMTGATVAGLSALTALCIATFSSDHGPPSWFPDGSTLGLILLGVWAYSTALAAAGVAARGMLDAKSAAEPAHAGDPQNE
jgi:hypothetical protein